MEAKFKKLALLFLGIFTMVSFGFAQSMDDAKNAIQLGDEQRKEKNYEEAVEAYGECVSICESLDSESADKLKEIAVEKWVKSHLDHANSLLKQNQHDDALDYYEKALELAKEYNQEEYTAKAERNIPKVWYQKGKHNLEKENFEDAVEYLNEAIEGDPEYGWAYIRKAQAYSEMEQPEDLKKAVEEAVAIGKDTQNDNVVSTAEKVAYRYFYNKGATALKGKDYETSAEHLGEAVKYNESGKLYHYLAISHGELSNFEEAAENEAKAIEFMKEDGKSGEELAKYYYALAGFYKETGNTSKACDAYKNAAYGDYKENAEYQIENVLDCN
ncbi:MAG: tetratricopeptide repeat protein [Bacteroidales bacterium]